MGKHKSDKVSVGKGRFNPYGREAYATEADLKKADPHIDDLVDESELGDDRDWLAPGDLEGRPPTYSTTWVSVYNPTVKSINGTTYRVTGCREKNCVHDIVMSSTFKELDQYGNALTPARKPPICHIVPWVLINMVMKDWDRKNPGTVCSPEFRRFACWGVISNLRPGHAACNLSGTKTMTSNYTSAEYKAAESHFDKARNAYGRPVSQ